MSAANTMAEIAPDVFCIGTDISNVYLLVGDDSRWIVVDSGVPGRFEAIKAAADAEFGANAKPEAIVLTHAHIDHCGSALALATYWDVPIYAHRLDLPYLTGKASLPPSDPTVGGVFAFATRFMPPATTDLEDSIRALPDDGSVPGMPDWVWVATPGHTPGHVSLFRKSDHVLIAGDAVLTVNTDDLKDMLTRKQSVSHPPAAATYDWIAVRRSLRRLAALKPALIASGHGIPMQGEDIAAELQHYADDFLPPLYGRYVADPATFDENGVVFLPPPPPDPLPKLVAAVVVASIIAFGVYGAMRRRSRQNITEE